MDPRPSAGFAIKAPCAVQGVEAALYINFCHHAGIGAPVNRRGQPVAEDELARGVAFLQIPIDVGTWRKMKASESSKLAYIVDVVYHRSMIEKLMHDPYCRANPEFREHLFELGMKTLESTMPALKITRQVTLVKKRLYVHADGSAAQPEVFAEITGSSYAEDTAKPPAPAAPEPLIEEVAAKKPAKPLVKKGFLNSDKAKGKLYGDGGSKEGVLPENAGDPLGYLPKGLRKTCQVVDCNDPKYANMGKPAEPVESEQTKMWKEMFAGYEAPSQFGEDGLDKEDGQPVKYSNDYSRFDRVADIPDAPVKDDRDWYYAEDGTYKSRSAEVKRADAHPTKATKDMTRAQTEEAMESLLREMPGGDMPGAPDAADFAKLLADCEAAKAPRAKAAQDARAAQSGYPPAAPALDGLKKGFLDQPRKEAKPQAAAATTPTHSVVRTARGVQVVVALPTGVAMDAVELDVARLVLRLSCPGASLEVDLPCPVDAQQSRAKFRKATRELVVTIPEEAQAPSTESLEA